MTDADKFAMLKAMTGETDEVVLSTYLLIAKQKVLDRAYPFGATVADIPDPYAVIQVEVACYLINKRGAEGETTHSENGVSRSYEGGDVPDSLLRGIVPRAGVIQSGE